MFQKKLILKIKNLIAQDKFNLVFEEIKTLTTPLEEDDLILLESRFHRNEKSWQQNLIRLDEYQLEMNKIGQSLLFFLNKITGNDTSPAINLEKAKYLFHYGSIFLAERKYLDAIQYFNDAILENPLNGEAYLERGAAKCSIGDYENALIDLSMAIKLSSQNPFAFYNRGIAYFELKQFEKALEDWRTVQELGVDIADEFVNTYAKLLNHNG